MYSQVRGLVSPRSFICIGMPYMTKEFQFDVFLSHNSKDKPRVRRLAQRLKDSGLVHISQMANRYVKNPYDFVAVGDVVTVWVLTVDAERRRVSLTMIKPGTERKPPEKKPPMPQRPQQPQDQRGARPPRVRAFATIEPRAGRGEPVSGLPSRPVPPAGLPVSPIVPAIP